jgi:hypothetical protein
LTVWRGRVQDCAAPPCRGVRGRSGWRQRVRQGCTPRRRRRASGG